MTSVGSGIWEIRVQDEAGIFRMICLAIATYRHSARLIRCLRGFQLYAITQTPRVVACRPPKFVRALRGFMSPAVTKVHIS
jgi:hypothetical protein